MRMPNSFGPNPCMVRMFPPEQGIEMELAEHDPMARENLRPPYTGKNPGGQMPSLELQGLPTLRPRPCR
ncbi:MAG: hypothetical protein GKR94_13190 [Gammaproteobacteria bacterium]|nr:hypothetical protein [Gammaproteobacteria bacterium]